jgi:hypothetical protein
VRPAEVRLSPLMAGFRPLLQILSAFSSATAAIILPRDYLAVPRVGIQANPRSRLCYIAAHLAELGEASPAQDQLSDLLFRENPRG